MHSWTPIRLFQDAAVFSSKVSTLWSMSDAVEKDKKYLIQILLSYESSYTITTDPLNLRIYKYYWAMKTWMLHCSVRKGRPSQTSQLCLHLMQSENKPCFLKHYTNFSSKIPTKCHSTVTLGQLCQCLIPRLLLGCLKHTWQKIFYNSKPFLWHSWNLWQNRGQNCLITMPGVGG